MIPRAFNMQIISRDIYIVLKPSARFLSPFSLLLCSFIQFLDCPLVYAVFSDNQVKVETFAFIWMFQYFLVQHNLSALLLMRERWCYKKNGGVYWRASVYCAVTVPRESRRKEDICKTVFGGSNGDIGLWRASVTSQSSTCVRAVTGGGKILISRVAICRRSPPPATMQVRPPPFASFLSQFIHN